MTNARDRYEQFHGRSVRQERDFSFRQPKTLVVLGKAIAIEYECDKWNGGGDGTVAVYRHEFETQCLVCMDETGRKQLYVVGNKLKVTDEGIEN